MTSHENEKIGVLMGGYSSERDISLKSGLAVFEALKEVGRDVVAIDIVDREEDKIIAVLQNAKIDVAFIALHGALGEDGRIQTILDKLDIPYSGSGPEASALALNKVEAQKLFFENNVKVPKFCSIKISEKDQLNALKDDIDFYPVVVKPAEEGSSLGIQMVNDPGMLVAAVEEAFNYGEDVLIEQYIKGREFTVAVYNGRPLPVVEIIPKNSFFDYKAKYDAGETEYVVPAQIPMIISSAMQTAAFKAHRLLRCEDFSRVDFIVDEELIYYLLEINTIPGFTATSLLPKAAAAENINFNQLCNEIIGMAYGKKKAKR